MESKLKNKMKTAVILCGGRGTRLGSLGRKIPKALVKVQKKEILWYIINILKNYNFNYFIFPLGYKGSLIRNYLKNNSYFSTNVDCLDTGLDSSIGKRIAMIEKKIKSKNFLLLNGDAIFNFNIEKIFKNHETKKMGITFLSSEIIYQYGTVGVLNNKVVDFKRNIVYDAIKTRSLPKYTAYNYTGMSIIKTDLIRKYKKNYMNSKNFEQSFFPRLIKKTPSKLIKTKGFWHSIDNLKDLFIVDQKKINPKKFNQIKKIKKFLK